MSFELIGHYVDYKYGYGGWTGNKENMREVVATFDLKDDAEEYIKESRLKKPPDRKRPFKRKSLLTNFEFATIEETQQEDSLPHNPRI